MTPVFKLHGSKISNYPTVLHEKCSGGGALVFQAGYHPRKWLLKHTLNTYFSGMKIDPKYTFFHAFFLICASCPFQNLSIWPKPCTLLSNFACFCTPKRCTCIHCLVPKNNPNYVNLFTRMNFRYKCPPGKMQRLTFIILKQHFLPNSKTTSTYQRANGIKNKQTNKQTKQA